MLDKPCRYNSGSTLGDLRGLAAPRRQDRRGESPALPCGLVDAFVVDPRRFHLDRAGRGEHLTRLVVPVAHHQPTALLVHFIGVGGDVRGDLGLQRGGQHPPCALPHDVID